MPKEEVELEPPPPKGQKPVKKNRSGVGGVKRPPGAGGVRGRPTTASNAVAPPLNSNPAVVPPHLPSPIPGSTATPTVPVPTTHATHNSLPQQVK